MSIKFLLLQFFLMFAFSFSGVAAPCTVATAATDCTDPALPVCDATTLECAAGGAGPAPEAIIGEVDLDSPCDAAGTVAARTCKEGLLCKIPEAGGPAAPTGFDGTCIDPEAGEDEDEPKLEPKGEATPVIEWQGSQIWSTYDVDGRECWNNSALAKLIVGSKPVREKKKLLEENSCRLEWGLECTNVTDFKTTPVTYKQKCRCMFMLGPQPATYPNENEEDDDGRKGMKSQCYIPAGKGWASECFDSSVSDSTKPYDTLGFPYPFGDPAGIGPDAPKLRDIFNSGSDSEYTVDYIEWNSIHPRCVPNSDCREGAKYIGRRCQCWKNATLDRVLGTCNEGFQLRFTLFAQFLITLPLVVRLYNSH